jgi:hypothetical protein
LSPGLFQSVLDLEDVLPGPLEGLLGGLAVLVQPVPALVDDPGQGLEEDAGQDDDQEPDYDEDDKGADIGD